ncbi:hypothetical protein AHAS_Ahas14G0150000 [Arachis hypogaea]
MEGQNQFNSSSSSSSSFTSELFGSDQSQRPSSNSGILASIFPPSSKVLGRESRHFQVTEKTATPKTVIPDDVHKYKSNDGETRNHTTNKDMMSSMYEEQRVQPCHLSSSIYYGGQDIYSHPQSTQNSGLNSLGIFCIIRVSTRRMGEKMTLEVLQEETGGKDLSIIRSIAKD